MYKHVFDLGSIEGGISSAYEVARMEKERGTGKRSFSFYCGVIETEKQETTYSIVIDLERDEYPFHLKREISGVKYKYQLDESTFLNSSFTVECLYDTMKDDMQAIESNERTSALEDLLEKENMEKGWNQLIYYLMHCLKSYYDKHERTPVGFSEMLPFIYATITNLDINMKEFVVRVSDNVAHMVEIVGQVNALCTGIVPLDNNDVLAVYIMHELLTRSTMLEELAELWGFKFNEDIPVGEVISFLASRMDM